MLPACFMDPDSALTADGARSRSVAGVAGASARVCPSHGWRSLSGPDPKGGGGALQTPKWLSGTMGFVGARGAGEFVLGIRQGDNFLFDPMCLYSKILRILWRIQKWMKNTKKDFDPDPPSASDLG